MKFCSNCGAQLPDQTKFCSNCGQKQEQLPVEQVAPVVEPVAPEVDLQAPLYTPPVQEPVMQEPVTSPAPPVQSFVPPVPPAQNFAPPAPPVQNFAPPVPPAPPVQNYAPPAPPVQNYAPPAPPVQNYAPPAPPAQNYAPSAAPASRQPESKPKSRLGLVAAGVVVLVLLAIFLLPKLFGGANSMLGRYECVSISMMGMEVTGDMLTEMGESWLELKDEGKCTIMLMDDKASGTWSADGDEITLEIEDEEVKATLKDGKLTMTVEEEDLEMKLVFEKGGKSDQEDEEDTKPTDKPAQEVKEAGYWTLSEVQAEDPDDAMDTATVALMKSMGIEVFLNLFEDGTGEGSVYMNTHIKWGDGELELTDLFMTCDYSINEGQLVMTMPDEDSKYVFVPGEGEAPKVEFTTVPATTAAPTTPATTAAAVNYEWWTGDWYGWWIVAEGTGSYADDVNNFWDACATMERTGENTGRFIIWDTQGGSKEAFLADVNVEFDEGWGDKGSFVSEKGLFLGAEVGYYDWMVDPELSETSEFENMICISGHYVKPSNAEDTFDYYIILRPWGMKWDDVETADTSDSLYDDMMPDGYESWYLPLLEQGVKNAPLSFEE